MVQHIHDLAQRRDGTYVAGEDDIGHVGELAFRTGFPDGDARFYLAQYEGLLYGQAFCAYIAGRDAALGDEEARLDGQAADDARQGIGNLHGYEERFFFRAYVEALAARIDGDGLAL